MLISPLGHQLIRSLRRDPGRWERRNRCLARDDGVELQFIHPYERRLTRPRLVSPREVSFGGFEGFMINRAIRKWLHRPI